ncbi:TSUP family transporter [Shewanella sp. AS16]|uniref:sulfite exporter TauE/SafE family protein n=1 Tax=Shewanella sp. AS16 TaxID=2907625 RepID=UPI001F350182|nr:TSUP family transporter [Shewanella sp. AS16]MCE9684968.1 TSUP family transporter [Shewanella sp. AS16]
MELLLTPGDWALLAGLGLIAGFIDAVVGGGGLLSIPALLTLGLPPHLALGTNKLAACFGSSMAAFTYYRQRLFTPAFWYHAFIATFIGAVAGSGLVYLIDNLWLEKLLPLLIIAIALYTLLNPAAMGNAQSLAPSKPGAKPTQWLQGLALGGYDGFAGPGIGAFWTVSSARLYRLPLLHSCGLARAMTFTSNLSALIIFGLLGQVQLHIGLWLGLCMMLGSFIGAHTAIKFGLPFIRPLFMLMVILITAKLIWSAWF